MPAKIFVILTFLLLLGAGTFGVYKYVNTETVIKSKNSQSIKDNKKNVAEARADDKYVDYDGIDIANADELAKAKLKNKSDEQKALNESSQSSDPSDKSKPFNILILGIDRRYGQQKHWRTDVIQLLTLSPDRSTAVVTHIPRDVWADAYKINAVYNLKGPEAMRDEIEKVTGQRPDRIIRVDFDAFVWAVDAVGGVTINVPRGFVDTSYPNDRAGKNDTKTVEFKPGTQTMDGETALEYARSRKGTNGEGSDYARGTRQQLVMKAVVKDFFKPDNLFNPKTAKVLYDLATQKVYTDLTLADTEVLFEVMKHYGDITVKQLSLDTSNFLVVPANRANYGGAWTLIPKGGTYEPIHKEIEGLME